MTKLQAGEKAPEFSLSDEDGKNVSLGDFAGRRVVVYFYPKDDTPGCTKEACQFSELLGEFSGRDTEVLGISRDDAAAHQAFRKKYDLNIHLLSDPETNVHQAFGACGERTNYGQTTVGPIRSTFLVGPDGQIEQAWYNVQADGHAQKVLEALGA